MAVVVNKTRKRDAIGSKVASVYSSVAGITAKPACSEARALFLVNGRHGCNKTSALQTHPSDRL